MSLYNFSESIWHLVHLLVHLLHLTKNFKGYRGSKQEYDRCDVIALLLNFLVSSFEKSSDVATLNEKSDCVYKSPNQ
jgi:hypothetical protein